MCTVTFVPTSTNVIITSNRDEQESRAAAAPTQYTVNDQVLYFPKDPKAGGTWFAVTSGGSAAVLLNGASERHVPKPPYRKSRGLIVLDILSADSSADYWTHIDLDKIEPFTLILFDKTLSQLRWDGLQKHHVALDHESSYIWSSFTLYPIEIIRHREACFETFLQSQLNLDQSALLQFHSAPGNEHTHEGFVIERHFLKTISITQAAIAGAETNFFHKDLISGVESAIDIFHR